MSPCPVCGKAKGSQRGSLTQWLIRSETCNCAAEPNSAVDYTQFDDNDSNFCPKCGLRIVANAREGSLTGFLFQSTRCKCPRDQVFADGRMSDRFWQLRQTGGGNLFLDAGVQSNHGASSLINLAPGAIIGGVYEIIKLLGRGGMGEVYLARHAGLGRKCALKVIPPEQVTEIGWQRFQLEAKAVARLDHVNLVRVTDLGIHDGCLPFYAMDYVEGKNLADLLAEQGPMPLKKMTEVFMQVCDGVECAHRAGILHRDLKPANIMLTTPQSGKLTVKVLDFGLAKLTKHDRNKQDLTAIGEVFGSPFYMSPEQCNGDRLDNRSDIYSLGCTLFECLTGRPPFTGHLASAIIFSHLNGDPPSLESVAGSGKFPASIEVVVAKILRKNPAERYQTLSQLKSDLGLVADGKDVLPVYASRGGSAVTVRQGALSMEAPAPRWQAAITDDWPFSVRVGVLLAGITSIFAIGFFAFQVFKPQPPVVKMAGMIGSPPAMFTSNEVANNQYYSKTISEGGKEFIEFNFPEDNTNVHQGVGGLDAGAGMIGSSLVTTHYMHGKVRLPKDLPIWIFPSRGALSQAHFFEKFRAGEITGIQLASGNDSDDLLIAAARIKGVSCIVLDTCPELTSSIIPVVGNLKLTAFLAPSTNINGNLLARMHFWQDLHFLDLMYCKDVAPILKQLKNSSNLEMLNLGATELSRTDFEMIATLHNLNYLNLSYDEITPEKLQFISSLPKLKGLNIFESKITSDSLVTELRHFPALTNLHVGQGVLREKEVGQLCRDHPGLEVIEGLTETRGVMRLGAQDSREGGSHTLHGAGSRIVSEADPIWSRVISPAKRKRLSFGPPDGTVKSQPLDGDNEGVMLPFAPQVDQK